MTGAARVWLALLATLLIAACGSAQPSAPPAGSPTPGQAACALTSDPGPADEPDRDGGDLIDLADWGGGRWRLCLAQPALGTAEGTVWCVWSADRTTVTELNTRPVRIGAIDYEIWLSINGNKFEFHAMDLDGQIANYEPGPVPVGDANEGSRSGSLAFDVVLAVDPESGPPPGAAPTFAGTMTWKCGDPPPPG